MATTNIKKIIKKIAQSLTIFYVFLCNFATKIYATEASAENDDLGISYEEHPLEGFGTSTGDDAAQMLTDTFIKDLLNAISMAGGLLLVFGLGSMILAFKDDNAEAKARAMMIILAAVFCITISQLLKTLGVLS